MTIVITAWRGVIDECTAFDSEREAWEHVSHIEHEYTDADSIAVFDADSKMLVIVK